MKTFILKTTILLGAIFFSLTAMPQEDTERYVVAKGDTIIAICQKFQISTKELLASNPGLNPTRLAVGQEIKIPRKPATALPLDTTSQEFKSAVNYGIAQTLYSTFELNCWSPLCGQEAFQLTQDVRSRLGQSVNVTVISRKSDGDEAFISVFLSDFRIGKRELCLKLLGKGTAYSFLEDGFEEEPLRYDSIEKKTLILPNDYVSLVMAEFRPTSIDIARLQRWCRVILQEAAPDKVNKTNHFFVAPFSVRYDPFQASVYWIEGRKVFRAELIANPDNERVSWKEMNDYSEPFRGQKVADYAGFVEWRNHVLSRHVVGGTMLTVGPIKAGR